MTKGANCGIARKGVEGVGAGGFRKCYTGKMSDQIKAKQIKSNSEKKNEPEFFYKLSVMVSERELNEIPMSIL